MVDGLFVTGTGTGVGKTAFSAALASRLRADGLDVGVMKPVETGIDPAGPVGLSDAERLAEAAAAQGEMGLVSPVHLLEPAAPSAAAAEEGRVVPVGLILESFRELARRHSFLIVEGAGGLAVPIYQDYLMLHLCRDMELPLLIVAPLALGAINHTVLTEHYARSHDLAVAGIVLNAERPETGSLAERTNARIIAGLVSSPMLGTLPFVDDPHSLTGRARLVTAIRSLETSGTPWPVSVLAAE